ncbi:MAG: YicC family protein [Eubacterium sp.]|nr:YicC family protein [Eubacterium sp.]
MVLSMTGFGRGEASDDMYKITVEMKSVNHRYLDINIRMPHTFGFYENKMRSDIKARVNRGKVDVFVTFEMQGDQEVEINYNSSIAASYVDGMKRMAEEYGVDFTPDVKSIARFPDVFTMKDANIDEERLTPLVDFALNSAIDMFLASRETEGKKLFDDISDKLTSVSEITDKIDDRYPEILEEYRERISKKAEEILGDRQIDERVLATEMVVYADKLCVDEEMVRLRTHISHMRKTLGESENIGRKLDFLTQELNREANTILSKSTDITIADYGIELKTLIEKIREQIQNIE